MQFEIVTVEYKGLLFEIVTVEHKRLPSEIVTVKEIGLRIIFFLLGFLNLEKLFLNYMTNLRKKIVMTWLLMWLNLSEATLNVTLQFLVIYKLSLLGFGGT